jgi:adenylylsulfate reductase subunit A
MSLPNTETIECDLLIIGGGMSGCGAAFESKYWSGDMKVVMVEKAVIERSGIHPRTSSSMLSMT